jgi:hypothetical protein
VTDNDDIDADGDNHRDQNHLNKFMYCIF